jgi:hypothetical protein
MVGTLAQVLKMTQELLNVRNENEALQKTVQDLEAQLQALQCGVLNHLQRENEQLKVPRMHSSLAGLAFIQTNICMYKSC